MKLDYEKNHYTKSYENDLANEIEILQLFSHYPNSLEYYGNFDKDEDKIIVLEKCDGDLEGYMKKKIFH